MTTRRKARVKLTTTPPVKRLARRDQERREPFCEICMKHGVKLTRLEGRTVCLDRASCERIAPPLFTVEECR